jgi:DNA repair exonuclease SbcCD ATPase subunit
MLDAIKPLLDIDLVNEETRQEINEAWEAKMTEAREEIRSELREEFARRYEHDKSVMVEALDKMVTESLTSEIEEIAAEKLAMAQDRVVTMEEMKKVAETFESFLTTRLEEEIRELHEDRQAQQAKIEKLEGFVIENLAEEIQEFASDKKAVVETRVRLVAEAKDKLESLKADFVARSAKMVQETVAKKLTSELTQLKEDIQLAKENNFGRKIFEAFAAEFGTSYLNENIEIKKLMDTISSKETQIAEAQEKIAQVEAIIESKQQEITAITESVERTQKLTALTKNLNKEKATIMESLLENVATSKLDGAFEKYLPAVLKEGTSSTSKKVLSESTKEVTGNKETAVKTDEQGNIIELRRLAGLK